MILDASLPGSLNFILGSATVMVGPPSALWDLTPDQNSLGLVKNFSFSTNPKFMTLSQGVPQQLIYSVKTGEDTVLKADLFEFTSTNLTYAAGNIPGTLITPTFYTLEAELRPLVGAQINTAFFFNSTNVGSTFAVGSWIVIQDVQWHPDHVHYAKLTSATVVTGTGPYLHQVTFASQPLKSGNNFPSSARLCLTNPITLGLRNIAAPYVSVRVTGVMPYNNLPIVVALPKVKLTNGFDVTFRTDEFSRLSVEMEPYPLMPTEQFATEFAGASARIFVPKTFGGFPRHPDREIYLKTGSRFTIGGHTLIVRR